MMPIRPAARLHNIVFLTAALAASSAQGQINEYENDATTWIGAARCHQAYSFDRFYPGISGAQGCLTGSTDPVTLQLATGTVTISVFNGATPVCPLQDVSTATQVTDVRLDGINYKAIFEFDPPVTAFYTYYGSLGTGATGTMKLYQNNVLQGTIVSPPSPVHGPALGHGFEASATPIDRVEITTTDTTPVIIGSFVGLAAGEPSLGTTTITGYNGFGGSQTIQLDFAVAFAMEGTIHNTTQNIWHGCIRDAIAFAANGDVLVVHPSVYHEAIDFEGKAVTITSTNPDDPAIVDDTVIDAGDTDWPAVQAVNGEGPNSALVGLTITNGRGILAGGERRGGGLYVLNSSPTIDRCHFIGNSSTQPGNHTGRGGAVYMSAGSVPNITGCAFTANSSSYGGAIFARRGGWSLLDCEFLGNTSLQRGGAISIEPPFDGPSSAVTIDGCTFDGNSSHSSGGAVSAFSSNNNPGFLFLEIANSVFADNHASSGAGGAIRCENAQFDVDGSSFIGNSSGNGSAIDVFAGLPGLSQIRNCRFVANVGDSDGIIRIASGATTFSALIKGCLFVGNHGISVVRTGATGGSTTITSCTFTGNGPDASVHSSESAVNLTNSIIWDDVIPSVSVASAGGTVVASYCNFKPSSAATVGTGVIHVDPGFVDPIGPDGVPGTGDEDLRLMHDSPCINAGLGTHDPRNPEFDLDGVPRHQGTIDMGAYEFELDCNDNSIPDHVEIEQGLLSDCNENLQYDLCEMNVDGNCNGLPDMCDILNGTLQDNNGNGFPDEFEVGGQLSGPVVWSTESGVCSRIVTQDLSILGSLTIQPGVRVQMLNGVKWTVLGSLIVNGTEADPVEFGSVNVNPKAGDWGGIRYASGSNGSLSWAVIQHTRSHGVRIEGAPVSVTDCTILDVAGIDQPVGTTATPAQPGGPAYGIYVSGNVSPSLQRNVIARVRGGKGGNGAFATGGGDGEGGVYGDSFGEDGGNGQNATSNGSAGVPGAAGGEAYGVFCGSETNATIRDNDIRSISGGAGGLGGAGGSGGWGGDGGAGAHGNYLWIPPACSGGDGGNGGNGSDGGNGSSGGNGANAYGIRVQTASGGSVHQNLLADIHGGAGGKGGSGGIGGYGGAGGDGAFGYNLVACGTGGGDGAIGGDGGDGGNGGLGGQGGQAFGISIGTTPTSLVPLAQNTVARLYSGLPGEAGSAGPAGPAGAGGTGGWSLQVIPAQGYIIPIPVPPSTALAGDPGFAGIAGMQGSPGALTGIRAEGQAIVSLANSILSSSNPTASVGVTATGSASLTLSYTLMNGFQTPFGPGTTNQGVGNLLLDPMFEDPDDGDFRLSSASGAIDVGNNAAVPSGLLTDLDGLDRIFDGDDNGSAIVDLGAYEFQPVADPCPADINGDMVVNVSDLLGVISSWGACPGCPADINGDTIVNVSDLLAVIAAWGPCP